MLDVSSENLPQKTHGTIVLHSVFHTLAYADVFDYPLTAHEVYRYITSPGASFEEIAQQLEKNDFFSNIEEYYTLRGREEIVQTRKRRAEIARQLWPRAVRYGGIIASLPFVKMVAVTGSLAMSNTEEAKDIDYLIVTAPNHLWTCRAFALLVTKLAKLEGVNLCPNYLITTNALVLEERSLYVAHELAQMIPLSGLEIYDEIRRLNSWMVDYLPNSLIAPEMPDYVTLMKKSHLIQKVLETLLRLPFAKWFEKWEMDRKIARLTQEQSSSFESYFSADVCKGHIDKHGQKTEHAIQERLKQAALEF